MSKTKAALPDVWPQPDQQAKPIASVPLVQPEPLGVLAHYSSLPATEGAGVITTLDLRDNANVLALQHALSGESTSLWKLPTDKVIGIQHIIAHYAEMVDDETGEVKAGPMLTLIGPDGVFHTMSKYAFRDLQMIGVLRGPPPWEPPIKIRALRSRSRKDKLYQSIFLEE